MNPKLKMTSNMYIKPHRKIATINKKRNILNMKKWQFHTLGQRILDGILDLFLCCKALNSYVLTKLFVVDHLYELWDEEIRPPGNTADQ